MYSAEVYYDCVVSLMLLASPPAATKRFLLLFIPLLVLFLVIDANSGHAAPKRLRRKPSSLQVFSTAQVVAAIPLQDFGSHVVRYGRLTEGGSAGAVFVQVNKSRQVTCITAVSLPDGKVLWQYGQPHRRHFRTTGDIPVQVYDWNGDDIDDVLFYDSQKIVVLSGQDGSVIASAATEEPYSLYIFSTSQFGGPAGLVLHGRSFNSLLAPDLGLVWRVGNGFSHFPMSVDIDGDGESELLAGYLLLNSSGQTIWNRRQLGIHNDSAAYGDVNCDGGLELAIATSGRAALLSPAGDIFWRGDENHAQHIIVGSFDSRTCERQIVTIDRDKEQSGILRMYDPRGRLLWKSAGHGNRAMLSRIDNWIADTPMSLILVSRSFSAPPTLYDGTGKIVARLPFPPALEYENGTAKYSLHFAQHFDLDNDGKEEIFVSNEKALWIYANTTPTLGIQGGKAPQALPNPRIYNATFYTGMQ